MMFSSARSLAAASRRCASGSLSRWRASASAASTLVSITSSSTWRNRSEETSSGSPGPIIPSATASRLTSEAQTVWPFTLATAWSPGSGACCAAGCGAQAASSAPSAAAAKIAQRRRADFPLVRLAFNALGSYCIAPRMGPAWTRRVKGGKRAMKFYNSIGPNPRVVKMFMAEKGIEIPQASRWT